MTGLSRVALVGLLAVGCDSDKAPRESDPAPIAAPGSAERNLETLRRYHAVFETRDTEATAALFSPRYRQRSGAKFGHAAERHEHLETMAKSWKSDEPDRRPQLTLVNGDRALEVAIATNVWASRRTKKKGAYPFLSQYRFEDGLILSRDYWYDVMTVYHQAGVPGIDGTPDAEAPWHETDDVVARGDELEAAQTARVREHLEAIGRADAAGAAASIAPRFVDRDLTRKAARTYDSATAFETETGRWLGQSAEQRVRVIDVWSAGRWTVAHFSRSYRLAVDLPDHPGSRGRSAHVYHLWLFHFDDDGHIAKRWRMRSRFSEVFQLKTVDVRDLYRRRMAVD